MQRPKRPWVWVVGKRLTCSVVRRQAASGAAMAAQDAGGGGTGAEAPRPGTTDTTSAHVARQMITHVRAAAQSGSMPLAQAQAIICELLAVVVAVAAVVVVVADVAVVVVAARRGGAWSCGILLPM